MRGAVRLSATLLAVLAAALVLVPPLVLAARTDWFPPGAVSKLWYRAALRALGWRVRVEGRLPPARPLLIVANHVSWADILVLGAQGELSFVAKSEVASWPVIGWLARLQNALFVDRERRRASGEQAHAVAGRLAEDAAVVLFAEGTTGDGNLLLPFKSTLFGALKVSARNGDRPVTVQPAAVAYTKLYGVPLGRPERGIASWIGDRSLGHHLWLLARHGPLDVVLSFGEPFAADIGHGRKELARRCEAEVRRLAVEALRGEAQPATAASHDLRESRHMRVQAGSKSL
ncbi:MAG TPA: lysophospholipid acyltransferase family protein [Mesorhizobium sp.]|jgi:1-acyl-sn-glycerol-3-phosphate acyltransferase|nr:lysophospholipid acyltransferase family protein [Mesorhizobium sp.]